LEKYDVAIIGGGILGTTISYWLSTLYDLKLWNKDYVET